MPRSLSLSLVVLAAASAATAQTPGTCSPGTATAVLEANDVRAKLFNTGSLFYGPGTGAEYEVPASSGKTAAYAANLWVGGRVGGEVRVAGATFGVRDENGRLEFEFWPGPLDAGAALPDPSDCSAYDRIWTVSVADLAAYEASGVATADLAAWPVGLGAAAVDAGGRPIPTDDRGRTLDLAAGERPVVYGSQTAFWVMNDVGGAHRTTGSAPLGVEVQVTAFAAGSSEAWLDQATVYRYRVVNRNPRPIEDLRLTWWTDTDLGGVNEYQGVDTTRALAFTYNESADRVYDVPPATGVDFLDQPLGAYAYRVNGDFRRGDPRTALEFDRTQRGLWNDGTPLTTYRTGYNVPLPDGAGVGIDTTAFAYTGDPVTRAFWSEINADGEGAANVAGNKRSVPTTRPVDLAPGESVVLTVAFLFAQGADHLDSITELRRASDAMQARFDAGDLLRPARVGSAPSAAAALRAPSDGAEDSEGAVTFDWDDVPGAVTYRLEVATTPDFDEPLVFRARESELTTADLPRNLMTPLYWRVIAQNAAGSGPPSSARSLLAYRYAPGALLLSDRTPAYVEVQGPGGVNPCGAEAVSTFGCEEAGGNALRGSLNSSGQYTLEQGEVVPASLGEREVEIRWTGSEQGSIARFPDGVGRVQFEIWDIGVTAPGAINDPSDDVLLLPEIEAGTGAVGCDFAFVGDGEVGRSPRVSARMPADPSEFAALNRRARGVQAGTCGWASLAEEVWAQALGSEVLLSGVVLAGAEGEALEADDLTGTTIRFYTADATLTRFDPEVPGGDRVVLDAPFPNPTAGRVGVTFMMERPGPARLAIVDVLGREVAVLAEADDLASGAHRVSTSTRGWAAGLYLVVLQTASGTASQRLTVAR